MAQRLGVAGRSWVVQHGSLQTMVSGYEDLITRIYLAKQRRIRWQDLPAVPTVLINPLGSTLTRAD